jgi:predicted secreted protein
MNTQEIYYNLEGANNLILNGFSKNETLPTLVKRVSKNIPVLDCQVILAHILNLAKEKTIYFSKDQIRYAFNQKYEKDAHGDKQSYLTWLYTLQVSVKNLNSAISRSNKAILRREKKIIGNYATNTHLKRNNGSTYAGTQPHSDISRGVANA